MRGWRALLGTAAVAWTCATPADATLLCMGTDPAFRMTITQGQAQIDHLGDGTFEVLPPVDDAEVLRGPRTHVVLTDQGRMPLFLDPRTCQTAAAQTPLRIEVRVAPTPDALTYRGCCVMRP